ncbi:autotransporter domain-containing protein [Acidithiobacillus caldus]
MLLLPPVALANPQIITDGDTVTDASGNTSTSGITVSESTLNIESGSALGSGLLDLQNGALRTSRDSTIGNDIEIGRGPAPATITSLCGGAYCFGVGSSMTLNTVGNTYVSTPSLLNQMHFPNNNKALGIWLTSGWQPDWMAGMQLAMQNGYTPVLFDYYLGDLGSMGTGAWNYVLQNAQSWLANTQVLANYLSTLNGTVTVVLQPEFNVPGIGNQPEFGQLLAQASQILQHAQHSGLTILTSAGVGDFGVYAGSTENASQWSTFYPSLSVAAPYLNFITFQEMRGADTGGTVVSAQQEGMSTIAGRVIAFSRYLQAAYGKPLLLGYMMMDPYTPPGDSEDWSAIAAKAYAEILQVSPELAQQGVFGSMAMELFNDMNHSTINGVDYFGTSSDYFGLVDSNGAPNTAAIGNGPYVLNANGQAWVNGTESAGTVQDIANGGTLDTDGNTDIFTGMLTGQGGLYVMGGGSATFTEDNTYTGNTYIEDSTLLQLGDGGVSGSILGNVLSDGVLSFNRSDNIVFPGNISGFGLVWQQGPGNLQLSGNNSYSGGTIVTGGTLSINNDGALGTGDLTLDGGTLETLGPIDDNRDILIGPNGGTINTDSHTDTFAGDFMPMNSTPDGGLTITGDGSAILTGNNSYLGGTTIAGYTDLQIGDGGSSDGTISGNVVDNGTLTFNKSGATTFSGQISGYGMVWQQGPGTLTLTGSNSYAGGTVVAGGTLAVGSESALGSGNITLNGGTLLTTAPLLDGRALFIGPQGGIINNNGNENLFAGNIIPGSSASNGGVTITGGGTAILIGNNTYSGGTTIAGYTNLQIGDGGAAGVLPGNVTDNGTLTFNMDRLYNYSGTINGYGTLWQQGPGTLLLSGPNTYAGGTTVAGGTLAINSAANIGEGPVYLDGGTLLTTTDQSDSFPLRLGAAGGAINTDGNIDTFDSDIVGNGGSLTVTGGGSLVLNGSANSAIQTTIGDPQSSSASPLTLLEIGDINHPSATLQGSVLVDPNGELRGHGTVVGNVTNNGTVYPGGSIGTLTVEGNYVQTPGGTLAIEVSPTAYDVLKISGTAAIAGKLLVQVDPGASYVAGDQYQVLQAAGGVTGVFTTTVYDPFPAYVTPELTKNNDSLGIVLNATPSTTGSNTEPAYLGGQIYADIPTALIDMNEQADALVLHHAENSGGAAVARTMLRATDSRTARRLAQFSSPSFTPHDKRGAAQRRFHVWVQGLGDFGDARGTSRVSGFDTQNTGVYAGADIHDRGLIAGVALGYVHTILDLPMTGYTGGSQATIGSVITMIYGKYRARRLRLQGLVGYTSEAIRGVRNLPETGLAASSDHHGSMVHGLFQGGYAIRTPWITVTPNIGVAWYQQTQPGFSESGATDLFDLRYTRQKVSALDVRGGVSFSRRYRIGSMLVTPYIDIAVQRELDSNDRSITETLGTLRPVDEFGVAPDKTAFISNLGASASITKNLSFYAEYEGSVSGNINNNGVAAGGVLKW